jgi:hypothetical integral membrane protein (TIGR02206 family)
MPAPLRLFGLVHLCILVTVPLFAAIFTAIHRKLAPGSKIPHLVFAVLLFLNSAMYYGYLAVHGQLTFPDHLPLELCDLSLWLVIISMLTLKPAVFDLAYYWALAGATQSLLTPNLPRNASAYLTVQFFLDHGLIVAGVLYLVWSRQLRPRPGSVVRSMIALNILAAVIGTFDAIFKTDYMFLRAKPATVSLLTWLGPWPWYVASEEVVGFALFFLLYLPFRRPTAAAAC